MSRLFIKSLITVIMLVFLIACNGRSTNKYRFKANLIEEATIREVYCDSFQMETLTRASVWVDGTKIAVNSPYRVTFDTNTEYTPSQK